MLDDDIRLLAGLENNRRKNWLQKYGNYDREELSTYSCVLWRLMLDENTRLLAGLENNREKTGFKNMVTMIEKS